MHAQLCLPMPVSLAVITSRTLEMLISRRRQCQVCTSTAAADGNRLSMMHKKIAEPNQTLLALHLQAEGAGEDGMLTRSVSPALLPVALPGAAIALPVGGALDFGERLFASEPPLSPMCVGISLPLTLRAHFLPLIESTHAAPLSAPKSPAHMLAVRLKPP